MGVRRLINEPAEDQAAHEIERRTLDAWSWIARARAAAAKSVEPRPPATEGARPRREPSTPEQDASAD